MESVQRSSCDRINMAQRFSKIKEKGGKQYAHIYCARSETMKPRLLTRAKSLWGDDVTVTALTNITKDVQCCIIGTLFKQMELQPSILKELGDDLNFKLTEEYSKYISEDDKLVLEDSLQRIPLIGKISPDECYTGSVVAVLGKQMESGQFLVEEHTYAGLPPQIQELPQLSNDCYVLLVSGLAIGGKNEKSLQMQLLLDYILGMIGESLDNNLSSEIVHMVVAGNSISGDTLDKESQSKAKYLTYKAEASTVQAMEDLDYFLSQLVPYISVDVMGGEFDLTNHILPQKPMHPCMFPLSKRYLGKTFSLTSNPYECSINGVHMLGSSGQNVNNMRLYSKVDDAIKLLSDTLNCQHIAPTAPDTLGCFPFHKKDPFIIDECPHVYFCANQDKFQSELHQGEDGQKVLYLCVPDFHKTSSAVLLNLKTLTADEFCIDCDWS